MIEKTSLDRYYGVYRPATTAAAFASPFALPSASLAMLSKRDELFQGTVNRFFLIESVRLQPQRMTLYEGGRSRVPCGESFFDLDLPLLSGTESVKRGEWFDQACGSDVGTIPAGFRLPLTDVVRFGAPVRRVALDGSEFDASVMSLVREGLPWISYVWGYRMGLVGTESNWDPRRLTTESRLVDWPSGRFPSADENISLVALPPPLVEGDVTEYINTIDVPRSPGGQYFYATTDAERTLLDSGQTGFWSRTGKSFKAGGYVGVCRFYGSVSPGPNTHFYTASESDCNALRAMQVTPTPTDRQQIHFEGKTFQASTPIPPLTPGGTPRCPADTIPLYRAYNAAWGPSGKRNYDSNHRFTTDLADIAQVVSIGWIDEGVVMCVPR